MPPELAAAIAAMHVDELRTATGQLLDLAGARLRRQAAPEPVRRRRRSPQSFSVTVRVDLVGAKPPVWRRLELPSTLRLDELHGVLQAVFGWTDSHLHRFSLGDSAWDDQAERFLCPYDVEEGEDDGAPTCDVRLDQVLALPGDRLLYTYDYGDEWNHRLLVEQVGEPVDGVRCTGGCGAAPPEDSGGIWDWDASGHRRSTWLRRRRRWRCGRWSGRCQRRSPNCCGTWRCCRPRRSSTTWPRPPTSTGRSPSTRPRPARRCSATSGCCTGVGDGLPLTAASWLPPAVVTEAMDALWPQDRWIGKRNRKHLTEPVRRLRASAQRLGLLRVTRRRLLVTKAGAALRDDPIRMWQHVAERLVGKPKDPFTRTATALLLLATAARSTTSSWPPC